MTPSYVRLFAWPLAIAALLPGLAAAQTPSAPAAPPPAPPRPALKAALTGDLGVVNASGDQQLRTITVGDKFIVTSGKLVLTQVAGYVYGQTNEVASANQLRTSLRADYLFHSRMAVYAAGSYERDRFAGFYRRTDESVGLSWKLVSTPRDSLAVDAGGVLTQEFDVDTLPKRFPAARAAFGYKHSFTKTSYLQQLGEFIPDVQRGHEYRVNTETDLVAPLSSHAGIKISYTVRYDSRPPATFGHTNRLLTAGIQLSF